MESYRFLLKPAFFIFNLVLATCLVVGIENAAPSDLGRFRSLFEQKPADTGRSQKFTEVYLSKLLEDQKTGKLTDRQLINCLRQLYRVPKKTE